MNGVPILAVRLSRIHLLRFWLPAILMMAGLRLLDLQSDPYRGLDWDTGLLTDEGFYTHNARSVALFGRARMDEFNNMLVSPLLHHLQVAVFLAFGFSAVIARAISVVLSLLTLGLFYASLNRAFGRRTAATGAVLLGLDHFNLLFNRMALLDTPAALLAVCSLYAFVRAARGDRFWMAGFGAMVALTVVTRSLCVYLIPAAVIGVGSAWGSSGKDRRTVYAFLAGLGMVLALYLLLWYLPHRAELEQMNRYYRTVQAQPDSVARLLKNIRLAFLGDRFGVFSNTFRHSPVVFTLALLGVGAWFAGPNDRRNPAAAFLAAWLLSAWALFALSSYAPNRYFVTTFPALFAIAALTLWRLPGTLRSLLARTTRAGLCRGAIGFILAFHLLQWIAGEGWWNYAAGTVVALAAGLAGKPVSMRMTWRTVAALLGLWAGVNGGWLADWWLKREYTLRDSSRWLSANLPSGSVLLGDVAPGLGMDTRLQTVNVMKGFANDRRPVETHASKPRYILTLDGGWKTPYWRERYPSLVDPARRLRHWRVLRWKIGLYPASP